MVYLGSAKFGAVDGHEVNPSSLQFLTFSNEEIRKLSVVKIVTTLSFDSVGNPNKGGLYDSLMGPIRDRNDICGTCYNMQLHCPGHFGHIELPLVVINPLFIKTVYTLFRISCLSCFKIQLNTNMKEILKLQLQLIDAGHVTSALELESLDKSGLSSDSSKKFQSILKRYCKTLKHSDPIVEIFHSKNADKLRAKVINSLFKKINITKSCIHCSQKLIKVTTTDNKILCNVYENGIRNTKIMMPDEIQTLCTSIANNDEDILIHCIPILKTAQTKPVTDIFFMEALPVVPPNIRPCNVLQGELIEHQLNSAYKYILNTSFATRVILFVLSNASEDDGIANLNSKESEVYRNISKNLSVSEKLHFIWQELQKSVNLILDSAHSDNAIGIKQIMEKKAGIIRMHMMGKRVNFAARSVITPDPNIDIDEIGIPEVFATKLTYPVPVTEWNVDELRKLVINGPNVHPGAELLELEKGRIIKIPADSIQKRQSLAKRLLTPDDYKKTGLKIVHRHLINGDVMILNRQPSLHKPSMMAHRARILKGEKTIRLHYANCKAYNADFDGDEMNAHFPQNEIARSEAYNIMSVKKQYLVPKDGTPLSGLIQDHVISGVKLSLRGSFYTKSDYQQLVFQALSNIKGKIILLPPAILKPVRLWTGKQILSTVIINIIPKGKPLLSLTGKAKINEKAWQKYKPRRWAAGGSQFLKPDNMSEAEVIIKKGELLSGVLDKTHYGATPYGLVHCMYELYGGDSSSALLSALSKLFTFYLQWIGFTLGVKDILVVDEANKKRDDCICLVRECGKVAAVRATDLPADVDELSLKNKIEEMMNKDPKFRTTLDRQYKQMLDTYTNNINKVCLSEGLLEKFPSNNLQLMVQSGAKGSTVNTMQISCLLGQIELEGKRPPLMISGRSLPSFLPYDTSPRAGGFIDGRFMTGIQPQEFFFHCMAGREGLIDTAVKTSRSGYLQRCLIKHLEGINVAYDHTIRDADGSMVQFAYGEDGLDVLKCQYFKQEQLEFLDVNSKAVTSKATLKKLKEDVDSKKIEKALKSINKWKKKHGSPLAKKELNSFGYFSSLMKNEISEEMPPIENRDPLYPTLEKKWRDINDEDRKVYTVKSCPDPICNKYAPEYKLGVVTEQFEELVKKYLLNRKQSIYDEYTEKEKFIEIMNSKFIGSLASPGEPVGLLAAQSIGEPSTQMTLNTFHFAGRGDMNVTLGIPRLREILMTASSKLKTPNMDIPFFNNIPDLTKKAEKLRKKLNKVTVADVLEKIEVKCEIVIKPERKLKTTMRFIFLPHSQYKTQYAVRPLQVIKHMEKHFFREMHSVLKKNAKIVSGVAWTSEKGKTKQRRADSEDEEEPIAPEPKSTANDYVSSEDEEPNEDDDQTNAKIRSHRDEEQEYEDPESEEETKSDDEVELVDEDEAEKTVNANPETEENRDVSMVVENIDNATNYIYDTKNHNWCELTQLLPISFMKVDLSQAFREICANSVIYEVKNIKRAITNKEKDTLFLKTEGINIVQMFKHRDLLDLNKLYSNDIHVVANNYGIEAANKVIVKEIQNVFNVYGIGVDPRHLSLIADYMTYNGVFEPMSRKGMEASTSPLQQVSFESSLAFLKDAVLNAKKDNLRSASSCLMVGQPCRSGTGSFDVWTVD